jgi:hypothetical protein
MAIKVASFRRTGRFEGEFRSAEPTVQKAAAEALDMLLKNPASKVLRLHKLGQFGKPTVWKIDVFANHAWQITFEIESGDVAKLCRLAPHKKIDRDPRAD